MRPDASFSLTGDGGVGAREFFFATRFDREPDGRAGNGRLSPNEREAAARLMATEADR
jgi:hypothetical protein